MVAKADVLEVKSQEVEESAVTVTKLAMPSDGDDESISSHNMNAGEKTQVEKFYSLQDIRNNVLGCVLYFSVRYSTKTLH